ncbi:MAG TPA: hypothetical protein VGT77_04555 [Sphingomonas sp.]|nr:hypothetical protein [Sphingomonas sp.]
MALALLAAGAVAYLVLGGAGLFLLGIGAMLSLAWRYDNHTGSLFLAAVLLTIVIVMLVLLIALLALMRA